jgi:uncharacterized protein
MKNNEPEINSSEKKRNQQQVNSSLDEKKSHEISGFGKRFYREGMGEGRFRSFSITCKDSDLWIGVDFEKFRPEIIEFARNKLIGLRFTLERYIQQNPLFGSSLIPIETTNGDPEIAVEMSRVAKIAGTGPMAAVAGAFSEYIGKAIQKEFSVNEIVVENGGDIYLKLKHDLIISVYAGDSPVTGKIGLEIPAGSTPLGICTSAGTVGPSFSFGKADAVMIASKNTALADAFATTYGNMIKTANDIPIALELATKNQKILSAIMICEGKVGICGQFKIKPIEAN